MMVLRITADGRHQKYLNWMALQLATRLLDGIAGLTPGDEAAFEVPHFEMPARREEARG
jgi:hypothetical protein